MEIFNNDCLDEMKNIKDNSIDLVFWGYELRLGL
jgi:DNA modification methylase